MSAFSGFVLFVLEAIALLGAIAGGYLLFLAIIADSAPQQAAAAAVGIGIAAIPYMVAAMAHRQAMRSAFKGRLVE